MISPLHLLDATYIAGHMRASDRHEVLAVSLTADLHQWATNLHAMPGLSLMVSLGGVPMAMMGAVVAGHQAYMWFVATEDFDHPESSRAHIDTHYAAMIIHRNLPNFDVKRCQVMALESNLPVTAWLARLGYIKEGRHPNYGKNGETFCTWAKPIKAARTNRLSEVHYAY